ncbi:MAG: thioredoxin family protein [Leptolyngbyaceae cyanobacterium CSU_1_3]|nr:thioredoxin family protein [Leptolyngbyaceae cyanobacterium CSU_1_3]
METIGTQIGSYAPDFEIPGIDGSVHHLARYLESHRAVAVVFMCNHCPYVKMYLDRLKQIQKDFQGQGFTLVAINPNDADQFPEDSFEKMKTFAQANQVNFPYLRDVTQEVANTFGAKKTPHVFLLNQQGVLCYNGAIDDSPQSPQAVQKRYLQDAIAKVLSGQAIVPTSTDPVGCSVKWRNS